MIGNWEGLNKFTFYSVLNYSTDSLITDGNFTFVFLNISDNLYIANPDYLKWALNIYANKKVFVLTHVSQVGQPFEDGHHAVKNKKFIDIINSHPDVVAVINRNNHEINSCYQSNTSFYNTSI